VGTYPRLFSLLLDQGDWTEEQLAKLAGKNMLRVLREVDHVSFHKLYCPRYIF
jgi:membrane dipeptidase